MNICISSYLRKRGFKITMLQRMIAGFFFMGLAMIVAGIVEYYRKNARVLTNIKSTCDDNIYVSDMSILWQVPEFILIGIGDVLASVSGLEFFNSQAPKHMKSFIMALFLVAHGIGSFMIGLWVILANSDTDNKWITNDLNEGHLDWYLFAVGAGIFLVCLCSIFSATKYHYISTL